MKLRFIHLNVRIYVFAMIDQVDVFICTHFLQIVVHLLDFMLMFVFLVTMLEIDTVYHKFGILQAWQGQQYIFAISSESSYNWISH